MNSEDPPIRVSIVEDNDKFRQYLTVLVSGAPGFTCTGSHATAEDALKRIPSEQAQVVIIDLGLPKLSGLAAISQLKASCPALEILVLTVNADPAAIFEALERGASGYLFKPPSSPSEILQAIQQLREGGAPMSAAIARMVVETFRRKRGTLRELSTLTPREREMLDSLVKGSSNKEIAADHHISERTVGSHLRNIYAKLHVRGRTEAASKYLGRPSST